jgi:hypothetical protein
LRAVHVFWKEGGISIPACVCATCTRLGPGGRAKEEMKEMYAQFPFEQCEPLLK